MFSKSGILIMKTKNSSFVISLDFELMWGVRDKRTIASYGDAILKVHEIIPTLIELFAKYDVKATFSTVGLLFGNNKEDLLPFVTELKPSYSNSKLNPYSELLDIPIEKANYYFAENLIRKIINTGTHEIGTHTFSHYYCNEMGQTLDQFDADIAVAVQIGEKYNCAIKSIVFPRNQVREDYLKCCKKHGVSVYRGNDNSGFYNSGKSTFRAKLNKILRFLDTYLPLSGSNAFEVERHDGLINVKASRFLRPYSNRFKFLEKFKIWRITNSMSFAAKHNLVYHLWWHPHNFGYNTAQNFEQLEKILIHYSKLREKYNMDSKTMNEFLN